MKKTVWSATRARRTCAYALSVALALGGWPTTALQGLAGVSPAFAEENTATELSKDDKAVLVPPQTIDEPEGLVAQDDDQAADTYESSLWIMGNDNRGTGHPNQSYTGLPGDTITLEARGIHKREGEEDTGEGFSYSWSIAHNAGLATITSEPTDQGGSVAHVHLNANDRIGWWKDDLHVQVTVSKGSWSETKTCRICVESEYPEIWFVEPNSTVTDSFLQVGASVQVTPEVRYFNPNGTFSLGTTELLGWDFDANAVSIVSSDGTPVQSGELIAIDNGNVPTFTITRISDWGTDVHLSMHWRPTNEQTPQHADRSGPYEGMRHETRDLHFDDLDYRLWFESEHDLDVWANGDGSDATSASTSVRPSRDTEELLSQNSNAHVEFVVGTWDNDRWVTTYDKTSGLFSVSDDGLTATVNAAKMIELGTRDLRVVARLCVGADVVRESDNDAWFHLRTRGVDYNDREWDRDMLPGWENTVFRWYQARMEDESHPDGEDLAYEVVDVTSSNEDIVIVRREDWGEGESADHKWRYQAREYGDATLTVTYQKVDSDETGSYDFTVSVRHDVYSVHPFVREGDAWGMPGESVQLEAYGDHWAKGDNDQPDTHTDTNDPNANFSVRWSIVEGAEYGTLASDGGLTNVLTFSDVDEEYFRHGVKVRATLYEAGEERAYEDEWFMVYDNEPTITPYPADFDHHLTVGKALVVEPRQLWRSLHTDPHEQDITERENVAFDLRYDPNCLNVQVVGGTVDDNDSGHVFWTGATSIVITRLNTQETNIDLASSWGNERDSRQWHFDELDNSMWFEGEHDRFVWTDHDGANPVDATNAPLLSADMRELLDTSDDASIRYVVGTWNNDDWTRTYDKASGLFSVSDDGLAITSNATKMAELGVRDLRVVAQIMVGDRLLAETHNDFWFHAQERETDYDVERDRNMLPNWDGSVRDTYHAWVRNEQVPDGEDRAYQVTNVEVIAGQEHLSEFREDSNGNDRSWYYRAKDAGVATLRVTYVDLNGQEQTYTFDLNIAGEVYDVEVWQNPQSNVQPGESVDIYARGRIRRQDEPTVLNNLDLRWIIADSDDYTTTVDKDDPTHVTITFRSLREGERADDFHVETWPQAVLYDKDGNERARNDLCVTCSARFFAIEPTTIDHSLDMLASTTIDPKVVEYSVDGEGTLVHAPVTADDLVYYWSFDPDLVRITDASGKDVANSDYGRADTPAGSGPFTITRLDSYGGIAALMARWTKDGRQCNHETRFFIADKDYELSFGADEYATSASCAAAVKLDVRSVQGIPGFADAISVQIGADWDDDANGFRDDEELGADEYSVTRDAGTWSITIPGSVVQRKLEAWQCDGLHVFATIHPEGTNLWRGAGTFVTLANAGTHALVHVAAKPATLSATGNVEHWRCDHCGKLFLDDKGTTEASASDVSIAKLVNIGTATITVPSYTYTGKSQTANPTVKIGTTVLKAGTDYAVAGNVATKAGSYTMTITGKGRYGGAKNAGFKIAKAANGVKASAVKATHSLTYKTSAQSLAASKVFKVTGASGAVTYAKKSGNAGISVSPAGKVTAKKGLAAGTYKCVFNVKAAGDANHDAATRSVTVTFKVAKAANPMSVKAVARSASAAKAKKAAVTVASPVGFTKKAAGKVTYARVAKGSAAALSVTAKTGKVTVRKGTKKGTYKVVVKVSAAGDANHKAASKTLTCKVSVK
ncbi:MAG: hypothetical protein J6S63_04210 [Atopobiaceae bacterium]|nr:hypothetical protein [Atopobiaceae bacterium]